MKHSMFTPWLAWAALAVSLAACSRNDAQETRRAADTHETAAVAAAADSVALCAAHQAPVNLCFICDASLREPGRLWCNEHGRYEDRCFICHPDLRDASRLYCEEHGLYEDECFICHPELRASRDATGDGAAAGTVMCEEHGLPESECGICHPELAAQLDTGESLKIRFPSGTSAAKAGVAAELLGDLPVADAFVATGELGYNLNRLAHITTPVDGVVKSVPRDVGQPVTAGTALLSIAAPRVAEVRSELIRALAEEAVAAQNLDRQEQLHRQNVAPARDLDDARARHESARAVTRSARQTLSDLGLSAEDIERFARNERDESLLPLRAPFAGTVVERSVALGDVVESGDVMFVVADLDVMWLKLSLPESDAERVSVGDRVDVGTNGRAVSGRVTWVASHLDEATRTVEVRVEIPNREHALRAGTFVSARVSAGEDRSQTSIDRDSIHRIDGRDFVFVRLSDDLYELRRVEARPAAGDRVAVIAGLHAGDRVVTKRSYLVKSELQKSRMGAGCVD